MTAAAKKLATAPPSGQRVRRGPVNQCEGVYLPDLEDAEAIQKFRQQSTESWATAQTMYDKLIAAKVRIPNDKFRYHWRRRCFCWPDDLRLS